MYFMSIIFYKKLQFYQKYVKIMLTESVFGVIILSNQNLKVKNKKQKKKRRKLKKKVKKVLAIILIFLCTITFFAIKNQMNKKGIQAQQAALLQKQKIAKEKKLKQQKRLEKKYPIKTYAEKTRVQLKKKSLNTYLILQTDERWASQKYGWGKADDLATNGCAIVSLAMVESFWKKKMITPNEILEWSKERYYTDQGTSWVIFPKYAENFRYQYHDLSDRINNALPYLEKNIPVIASVYPGRFTDVGHIMVLTSYDGKYIHLLDPNDNKEKQHSLKSYTPDEIQQELAHLWVIYK